MKGNNGKAARRKLTKRIVIIIACFASVLAGATHWKQQQQQQQQQSDGHRQTNVMKSLNKLLRKSANSNNLASANNNKNHLSQDEILQGIREGRLSLVNIRVESKQALRENNNNNPLAAIRGEFCNVDWTSHKRDPSSTPMFRDVVAQSPDCQHPHAFHLGLAAQAVQEYDARNADVRTLPLAGVVFHESRCGSTLVANMLQAVEPDAHRVYSESPPPVAALRNVCGEDYEICNIETAATVLQSVILLMSRSRDPREERVYFKIQSIGTRTMEIFLKAFPTVPWLFVYRNPVQVLQSQLAHGIRNANCVRAQRNGRPTNSVQHALQRAVARDHSIIDNPQRLDPVDYCALHLATLTTTAWERAQNSDGRGNLVEYDEAEFLDRLDFMWPAWLPAQPNGLTAAQRIRVKDIGQQYSKGRGNKQGIFTGDSQRKMETADPNVQLAAQRFLQESYDGLRALQQNTMQQ